MIVFMTLAALATARPAWCAWQTFGLADGLASAQVSAIAQDHMEDLWFGTPGGVSRYDGVTFRTFTTADGLANNGVLAILADRSGRIWFGTQVGVSNLDGATWTTYTVNDGLTGPGSVRAILQDRAGRMWFATPDGVSRFDGTNWLSYHQVDGLAANAVSCMFEDRTGNLWFGTQGGGVSRFDGSTWTTYTSAQGLAGDDVLSILETHDGALWFGTNRFGLSRFDGSSWRTWTTAGNLSIAVVNSLREDRAGALWVGASNGVARFDGLTWRAYTVADGLVGTNVSSLELDDSGNVWVGGDAGVSRYDGENWTPFLAAGLGTYGAQALLEDRTGVLWAGTLGAGLARYDRTSWTSVRASDGLASDRVAAIAEDSTGALWFGTNAGASRYDGAAWRTYTVTDGLAGNDVRVVVRDPGGAMWFGTTLGLTRHDGVTWQSFTTASGLPADRVRSLAVDNAGRLWCGTSAGVSRLDGATWTNYSTADGLVNNTVSAILQDHSGTMWFGTPAGLSRFDGSAWTSFTIADGLGADAVLCMKEDREGVLWVGAVGGGVTRFDGILWHIYTEGLPALSVSAALVEHSGNLWFGTAAGAVMYEPDRVPPQTVITSPAPALSASTLQTVRYAAAFREIVGIDYSTSLDNAPWSPWTTDDAWIGRNLPDGTHMLQVRARDRLLHIDPTPASCTFAIDATAPAPVVTAPVFRQPVRDTMVVRGTAVDARFRSLRVDLRSAGAASWDPPVGMTLAQSNTQVVNGDLARLATKTLPDGDYELRLGVTDTLGLTGVSLVTFVIDNVAPWAEQTTPALVSAEAGGDVYTTQREAHLFVPPHALARDATIGIEPLAAAAVSDTMPDGATRVAPGFSVTLVDVSLADVPLTKAATLGLAVSGGSAPPGTTLALYVAGDDGVWRRLGGTFDAVNQLIETPISVAGRYAIGARSRESSVPGAALALSLTPRVFSPRAGLASPSVGIGFVLARTGAVTVTVHNRAGRLVRVVMSGTTLGAGTNLVRWDGRDEDRREVEEGLYLVTVEALGDRQVRPLAVVR